MRSYLALVEAGDDRQAFGIRFPDLPGVFSAADTEDDIIAKAIEALRLWAEDEALPEPSNHAAIVAREDVRDDLSKGRYLIAVPLIESDPTVRRVNITMERGILDAVDAQAKAWGTTRSGFLSQAARNRIERTTNWAHAAVTKKVGVAPTKRAAVAMAKKAAPAVKKAASAKSSYRSATTSMRRTPKKG